MPSRLAGRRADVAELNACGHVRAQAAGYLDGPILEVGGVPMQAGDRVMMLRNDTRVGIRNGNRGVILDVDPDQRTMRVRLPRGEVDLPTRYLDAGHVGLAYAITVNKAHGMTCDATMMVGDDLLYRELAYEAMSRGRKENRIYMSRGTTTELDLRLEDGPHAPAVEAEDPLNILAAGLERRRNKQLALDSISPVPLDTWSTSDLVAERRRIQAVLDQTPPDRTADLAALEKSRRDTAQKLDEQQCSVARLETRKRPRKERRLPDVDLMNARRSLEYFGQQVDRLDHEIVALHSSQHRRASCLAAHGVERVELDAIDDVLQERLRQQTNRAVQDPPTYITKTLGARPKDRDHDRVWVRAVVEVERYRMEHNITDGRTLLGPKPTDRESAQVWRRAEHAIGDAADALAEPTLVVQPAQTQIMQPTPAEGPTLDIGL